MTKRYGVISDLHALDIKLVVPTIQYLKDQGVDGLVLNGDTFGERSGYNPKNYFATVLDIAGRSGIETFVLPGSHEEVEIFEPVLDIFTGVYGNLVNVLKNPKVEKEDHHLVFLPGSDTGTKDTGYILQDKKESGVYHTKNRDECIRFININDLRQIVSSPEKTVLFSHVPRRFSCVETCVDMAEFGQVRKKFMKEGHTFQEGTILPGDDAHELRAKGTPVALLRKNCGNTDLAALYDQLGITKSVSGHFHESAGRANNTIGMPVQEGAFVTNLFYNASCMDRMIAGILTVDGVKVAYRNVDLRRKI